ncbi:AbiJ-NTD4 domain-containing protein [Pedosphaera parvula]|uniref:HEPN AbiJ-N-terminal domain-containing protein n=1 Tax=Pedosphaera parvula (strain Ellin514) TaxID=320771 RepID=B9XKC7_PEDPL|nr:hypothetical protein [Pedosphaera parvula]EEF59765.1 hypothetical protein Cflav_PD2586 [Pedosphaera parvula Ellin514]
MNLFSKSQNDGKKPDALSHDLPYDLRVQIMQIWEKGFGEDVSYHPGPGMAYRKIYQILCEEHKLLELPQVSQHELPLRGVIAEYFFNLRDVSMALDVVQVVFNVMENMMYRTFTPWGDNAFSLARFRPADIIEELNRRFNENNVGYQYVRGQIVTIPNGPPPLPLAERLVAGEPARNIRKIQKIIGGAAVVAIHDPYIDTASLLLMTTLADMGTTFSPSLRILGTIKRLSKTTEKQSFLTFLADINTERQASWEVRICPASIKPHRRFLVLHDGSIVTCGMSLNHIDKDEVLDHEPTGSENARHDSQLFEQQWSIATLV